jgi:uncharacterized protein (DUF924 family)
MVEEVLGFWFDELMPGEWWMKDTALDQQIRERFSDIHAQACRCELFAWRSSAKGRLAEILVLDQFSRNMHRDSPLAFANDPLALALAQEAIDRKSDQELEQVQRTFMYMPFMHSESPQIHEIAVGLFEQNGLEANLDFELKHKRIIDRFGRYPHRNAILGRVSTPEEIAFLSEPGSSF